MLVLVINRWETVPDGPRETSHTLGWPTKGFWQGLVANKGVRGSGDVRSRRWELAGHWGRQVSHALVDDGRSPGHDGDEVFGEVEESVAEGLVMPGLAGKRQDAGSPAYMLTSKTYCQCPALGWSQGPSTYMSPLLGREVLDVLDLLLGAVVVDPGHERLDPGTP